MRSLVFFVLAIAACSDTPSAPADFSMAPDLTPMLLNGCPTYPSPIAMPGDPVNGDTYAGFARGFLDSYCVRCHSTSKTGAARENAPPLLNWDVEATVRANLADIRNVLGVANIMPPSAPTPTCDERRR